MNPWSRIPGTSLGPSSHESRKPRHPNFWIVISVLHLPPDVLAHGLPGPPSLKRLKAIPSRPSALLTGLAHHWFANTPHYWHTKPANIPIIAQRPTSWPSSPPTPQHLLILVTCYNCQCPCKMPAMGNHWLLFAPAVTPALTMLRVPTQNLQISLLRVLCIPWLMYIHMYVFLLGDMLYATAYSVSCPFSFYSALAPHAICHFKASHVNGIVELCFWLFRERCFLEALLEAFCATAGDWSAQVRLG